MYLVKILIPIKEMILKKEQFRQLGTKLKKKWKYIIGFGIIIGILSSFVSISGYSLKDIFASDEDEIDYFDITVFVNGKAGKHDHILENKGKVVLLLNTDKRDEKIGDKGEVNFKELPGSFEKQKVTFYLIDTDNEPYQLVNPDSQYVLIPNRAIHLTAALSNLDQIKGTVRNAQNTSERLSNVKICIEDICVYSDEDGHYLLQLPESLQKKFHTISFRKNGFEEYVKYNAPMQIEKEFDVILKPRN